MTVENLFEKMSDAELIGMYEEYIENKVLPNGPTQQFIKKVNRLIVRGEMEANTTGYTRISRPTVLKLMSKELAQRYYNAVMLGMVHKPKEEFKQMSFNTGGILG